MKNKQNQKLVEGKKYHKDQGRNKWNRKKKTTEKNQLNSKVGFEKRNEIDTVLVRFNKKKRGLA